MYYFASIRYGPLHDLSDVGNRQESILFAQRDAELVATVVVGVVRVFCRQLIVCRNGRFVNTRSGLLVLLLRLNFLAKLGLTFHVIGLHHIALFG